MKHQFPGAYWKDSVTSQTLPYYGPQKRVDQDKEGERLSLVNVRQLSTVDGQGSCCQDVWLTVDEPH